MRPVYVLVAVAAVAGYSSSGGTGSPKTSTSTSGGSVQTYLAAVNALCDGLQARVIEVTHGGSLDIPVADYLAQQPAHATLLSDFDQQVAKVPVPPAAKAQSGALATYVRFADQLDAKRLAAARQGAAAYAAEIGSEKGIAADPAIAGLSAAGFNDSCQAR